MGTLNPFKIRGRAVNKHSIAPHLGAGYGPRLFVCGCLSPVVEHAPSPNKM
jgi:hypothetical protein